MDPITQQQALASAGAGGDPVYVDDVFSVDLWDGTASARTITNNVDLSGEGGLVWLKSRGNTHGWRMVDTERGATEALESYDRTAETTESSGLTAFTSTGFTVGTQNHYNGSGFDMASYTFRKTKGFFDIVTYTGNGTFYRTVSHNLGSVPGSIWIKRLDQASNWEVYHRELDSTAPQDYKLYLNESGARINYDSFADTAPTATEFTLGSFGDVNANGGTFVAYLFAHDIQTFGEDGDEAIIKCGSYTGTGSDRNEVTLGFEPQWLLIKNVDDGGADWLLLDVLRGANDGISYQLRPNLSSAEFGNTDLRVDIHPDGFSVNANNTMINGASGDKFIYIAIRRENKPPEAATDVFHLDTKHTKTANTPSYLTNFPVDLHLRRNDINSTNSPTLFSRVAATERLQTDNTNDATTDTSFDDHFMFTRGYGDFSSSDTNDYGYSWKRAPGFCDVVTYYGHQYKRASENISDVPHNLGTVPEMIWVKARNLNNSTNSRWVVYHKDIGNTDFLFLHEDSPTTGTNYFGNEDPTATDFKLFAGGFTTVDYGSSNEYMAFLFGSVDGISKVGSYTGDGTNNRTIDCGFTNGARFVIIKRSDLSAGWFVFDSQRGIVSGNDNYFMLHNTDAQVTSADYIEPANAGFAVNNHADFNASGGTYIFYAVA